MVIVFALCLGDEFLCCLNVMYVFLFFILVRVTEWPPIGK